ncbi:hypothetical protein [Subtercola boreus]|uniref:hypothetical protein n=1 Tax=Subtercola boreus TaxID=120213 RepID=UPI001473E90B|nr:hypothetical protein [Subtercola boreus]
MTPLVGLPFLYVLAILIGTVGTALLVIVAKNPKRATEQPVDSLEEDDAKETSAVNA